MAALLPFLSSYSLQFGLFTFNVINSFAVSCWAGFNTVQVTSETIFPANLLTGTKHSAFSTNHLTDIDKNWTELYPRTTLKPKQRCKKTNTRKLKLRFQVFTAIRPRNRSGLLYGSWAHFFRWKAHVLCYWRTVFIPAQNQKEREVKCWHQLHCATSLSNR